MYFCDSNCIMLFIFTLFYAPPKFYLIHVFLRYYLHMFLCTFCGYRTLNKYYNNNNYYYPSPHQHCRHPCTLTLSQHTHIQYKQHYSIFTLQTYHHPEHRFMSWPTQMTSPSLHHHIYTHKHEYSQAIHTTIPT